MEEFNIELWNQLEKEEEYQHIIKILKKQFQNLLLEKEEYKKEIKSLKNEREDILFHTKEYIQKKKEEYTKQAKEY